MFPDNNKQFHHTLKQANGKNITQMGDSLKKINLIYGGQPGQLPGWFIGTGSG